MREILLIGNGPSCLKNKCRDLIDSHETVVRFNNFELNGYEDFVGTKTNIWVRTKFSKKHLDTNFDEKFYVYPGLLPHSTETLNTLEKSGHTIVPLTFYNEINKLLNTNGVWATTGTLMIYYFISKGYMVKIHGFDFFTRGVHYYKDDCKMSGHNPEIEKKLVNSLINGGKVKVLIDE